MFHRASGWYRTHPLLPRMQECKAPLQNGWPNRVLSCSEAWRFQVIRVDGPSKRDHDSTEWKCQWANKPCRGAALPLFPSPFFPHAHRKPWGSWFVYPISKRRGHGQLHGQRRKHMLSFFSLCASLLNMLTRCRMRCKASCNPGSYRDNASWWGGECNQPL